MLRLHNTLTGTKDIFTPDNPQKVSLYTCGPTVYSEPHVGNWVAFIRWDLLVRTLIANGFSVKRTMNITDVGHLTSDADEGEDKMTKGARLAGSTEWDIAKRYIDVFLKGMTSLNLLSPEHMVRATDHISEQIALVEKLEQSGHTYLLEDGVYFDTSTFPRYADFAHLDLAAQKAGARVDFNSKKHNSSDFVLWRLSPKGETRTMEWESPWGKGIPGWHIECSAMAMHYLGETIDIHTGGIDHIPVHHTNEIAQSEAATGKEYSRVWLHANFLLSDGKKISKSLGNGYKLEDITSKDLSPLDFKLFVLQSHYRTETNFSWENLQAAANRRKRWQNIACLRHQINDTIRQESEREHDINGQLLACPHALLEALNDDLNSPLALKHIDTLLDNVEKTSFDDIQKSALTSFFEAVDELLGIDTLLSTPDVSDDIKQVLIARQRAREDKDWELSDTLRDELTKNNVAVNDAAHGSYWYWI
jgi:cysteinyl-tRNA synthetase